MPEVFNNSLWTTCGVAPITETCSSSPISLDTTIDIDPNCDIVEDGVELICTHRFLEPIFDALEDAGDCQAYLAGAMEECGVNEEGERCALQSTLVSQSSIQTQIACSAAPTSPALKGAHKHWRISAMLVVAVSTTSSTGVWRVLLFQDKTS